MNIRNQLAFGGKSIPSKSDAVVWLDGTISGNNFVDKISGRLFPIANKDFPAGWTRGFPYKSAATFSAPAGDAVLIAADVNNFFYTAGIPNQIPVISLFQNVDYANRLFCRHISQSIDIDTYAETYEPRVAELVLYSTIKSGVDLSACNSYFNVPVEVITSVKWVDPVNGVDTNAGTKISPWKSLTKAETSSTLLDTIYVRSGIITEANYWNPTKTLTYKAIGNVTIRSISNTYVVLGQTPSGYNVNGFTFDGENNTTNVMLTYNNANYDRCRFINPKTTTGGVLVGIQSGLPKFTNSIIVGGFTDGLVRPTRPTIFDSCYLSAKIITGAADSNLTITNCRYITTGLSTETCVSSATALNVLINGGDVVTNGNYSFIQATFSQSITASLNIKNCKITINSLNIGLIDAQNGSFHDIDLSNNFIVNNTSKDVLINRSGANITISNNVNINNSTGSGFNVIKTNLTTCSVAINNNLVMLYGNSSYGIGVGNEVTSANDNSFSNINITKNKVLGAKYFNASASIVTHGIFVGFQGVNCDISYNYVNGAGIGLVVKGSNTNYSNLIAKYNLFKDNLSYGVYFKGAKFSKIYNCTLEDNGHEFHYTSNTGLDGSSGNTVKNCILSNNNGYAYYFDALSYAGGNVSENNTIYFINKLAYNGTSDINPSQWNSDGFDLLSVFANPLLVNLIPSQNSPAIGVGADLGVNYNTGLDASTNWGSESQLPVVITKQQPVSWDCGAYIH